MKFNESSLVGNFCLKAKALGLLIEPHEPELFAKIIIAGASDFLQLVKLKEESSAIVIEDLRGNVLLAGAVSYEKNEDPDMPGNWNYYWTFDKEDIKDCKTYSINSSQVFTVFSNRAFDIIRMKFACPEFLQQLATLLASSIIEFLDENAVEGEEFVLELDGYFRASVVVENGEKVKSFVPDGAMKKLIKDDLAASADIA